MELDLSGKCAMVTGSSKGIGFAIARRLLAEGCNVKLVARDPADLEKARAALVEGQRGAIATAHPADLGDQRHLEQLFPLLTDVDILVNSAGAVPRGKLLDTTAEAFRAAFNVKVMGTIDLCREAYRHMSARRSGVIINIIGLSGERPNPKSVPTSTANGALIAFTQAVGCISADENVRVVGVNPGLIATPRTASMSDVNSTVDRKAYDHLLSSLPFGRMGRPEEIADMVAFLASPRASYVSGCVYTVDGGARFRV